MKTSDNEILDVSLRLFSEKGFDGTSVRDIAKAIGITQSSLYKHYSSKEEILSKIFEEMKRQYEVKAEEMSLHIDSREGMDSAHFASMSPEKIAAKVRELIEFSVAEPFVRDFRKLLTSMQFRSPEYSRLYTERYGERMVRYHEKLFLSFISCGSMKEGDPHIFAIEYTAPVFYLLGVIDREPERMDECLEMLEKHVISFYKMHTEANNA